MQPNLKSTKNAHSALYWALTQAVLFCQIGIKMFGTPKTRFHDLRHSFIVSSIRTGDVYGHVTDQMHKESAVRMDRFIENVPTK